MADDIVDKSDQVDGCVASKEHTHSNATTEDVENTNQEENNNEEGEEHETELQFVPKVNLPIVVINSMEDNEDVVVELRSRIYRYNISEDGDPEFKERGTGTLKILQHRKTETYRVLMRRDKTLKICANHQITSTMDVVYHRQSKKVLLYSTLADFYEGEISAETFAIRFANAEDATIFKNAFEDAVSFTKKLDKEKSKTDELSLTMEKIKIEDEQKKEKEEEKEEDGSDTKSTQCA